MKNQNFLNVFSPYQRNDISPLGKSRKSTKNIECKYTLTTKKKATFHILLINLSCPFLCVITYILPAFLMGESIQMCKSLLFQATFQWVIRVIVYSKIHESFPVLCRACTSCFLSRKGKRRRESQAHLGQTDSSLSLSPFEEINELGSFKSQVWGVPKGLSLVLNTVFRQAALLQGVLFNYWELLAQLLEWMNHTLNQIYFLIDTSLKKYVGRTDDC